MKPLPPSMRIPGSTYRLQFNRDFTFKQAHKLIPYLEDLGITDVYSSPIFTAPPESNHGYDVCDYNSLNPLLGSSRDFEILTLELRRRRMSLLMDFVPNHMGASPAYNIWWRDVLENGAKSQFAHHFDIDWNPPQPFLKNKVLLPILEDEFETVLAKGLFKLEIGEGGFQINYRDLPLPVSPESQIDILTAIAIRAKEKGRDSAADFMMRAAAKFHHPMEHILEKKQVRLAIVEIQQQLNKNLQDPNNLNFFRTLLEPQNYLPAYWRTGSRIANYRRFFDVDGLVAVSMDRPEVFQASHRLLGELVKSGKVTGLRLDHIDGLADPKRYLLDLQTFIRRKLGADTGEQGRAFNILVEKITMPGESLRADWPVSGTSGYEFLALVNNVLLDAANEKPLTKTYADFVSGKTAFWKIVSRSKKFVMQNGLSKEIGILTRLAQKCSDQSARSSSFSMNELEAAITSIILHFPRYRTYLDAAAVNREDRTILEEAFRKARITSSKSSGSTWMFLKKLLLSPRGESGHLFRQRFQQFTGPIMAKSYEDTAFFIYNRLISLNEVGSCPADFGITIGEFHRQNQLRLKNWPNAMLTTSTHDTKLSEDARARVSALSQLPAEWEKFVSGATRINAKLKTRINGKLAPDKNEEYRIYQTLLATWPLEKISRSEAKFYTQRIEQSMIKALREAKIHSSWNDPGVDWENAVTKFLDDIINRPLPLFSKSFGSLVETVAQLGAINSLSQTLLKLTAPGVPDFYQGNEIWQFLLTDPDNRRSIDYVPRQRMLKSLKGQTPSMLLKNWRTGAIKMFLIRTLLQYRRSNPLLFSAGEYIPLSLTGNLKENCVGFSRVHNGQVMVVLAPRLSHPLGFPPIGDCWGETTLKMKGSAKINFTNLFTGASLSRQELYLSKIFKELPFAVLISK